MCRYVFASAADLKQSAARAWVAALKAVEEALGLNQAELDKAREHADADKRGSMLRDMPEYQDTVAHMYMRAWNNLAAYQGAGLQVR